MTSYSQGQSFGKRKAIFSVKWTSQIWRQTKYSLSWGSKFYQIFDLALLGTIISHSGRLNRGCECCRIQNFWLSFCSLIKSRTTDAQLILLSSKYKTFGHLRYCIDPASFNIFYWNKTKMYMCLPLGWRNLKCSFEILQFS